eukprot:GHRR01033561.1.p2 GENE.GHRR01033561.1~~GHRR01033561.1.p2  ORF type:complete len:109 (-),score=21.91 GHRR01033561.1:261-587(-)
MTAPSAVQFVSLAVESAGEIVVAGTQDDFQVLSKAMGHFVLACQAISEQSIDVSTGQWESGTKENTLVMWTSSSFIIFALGGQRYRWHDYCRLAHACTSAACRCMCGL